MKIKTITALAVCLALAGSSVPAADFGSGDANGFTADMAAVAEAPAIEGTLDGFTASMVSDAGDKVEDNEGEIDVDFDVYTTPNPEEELFPSDNPGDIDEQIIDTSEDPDNVLSVIEDEAFLHYVQYNLFGGETAVTVPMCSTITSLNLQGLGITSLEGIQFFRNLEELNCYGNKLLTLDLGKNTKLVSLNCGSNQLSSLNLDGCEALTYLNCQNNRLLNLDLQNCPALTSLDVSYNYFATEAEVLLAEKPASYTYYPQIDLFSQNTPIPTPTPSIPDIETLTPTPSPLPSPSPIPTATPIPAATKVNLDAPSKPTVANKKAGIEITWKKVANAQDYEVYRKAEGESSPVLLGSTQELSYIDTKVEPLKQYRYYIQASTYVKDGFTYVTGGKSSAGTTVRQERPTKPKAKVKKGKVTLTLSLEGVTGCQIRYAGNAAMENAQKLSVTESTKVLEGLAKGTWYVQYRTYVTIGGKKYYSSFSKARTFEIV